jgi:hypothetical protein
MALDLRWYFLNFSPENTGSEANFDSLPIFESFSIVELPEEDFH